MPYILGLDPSIRKTGFCVLDTEASDHEYVEMGRLTTFNTDGILVQRLIKQSEQIRAKIKEYSIKFISMEAPIKDSGESEELFALNQFLHRVFLEEELEVIAFPPTRLKKLAVPEGGPGGNRVDKPQMIVACKRQLKLRQNPVDDAADAFWAAFLGKEYWKTVHGGREQEALRPDIREAFFGKKTFKRGVKAGVTLHEGMVYRINEFHFDFAKLKLAKGIYGHGSTEKESTGS